VTTSTLRELEWQDQAACRGMGLDAFFPLPGVWPEAAQRACSRCPVAGPCRDYGATQEHGVWGGLRASASERGRGANAKPAVPEALQPPVKQPYSCQGTANTTTTPPQEAPAMTAKTTATVTPAATPTTADETRTASTVSKDGEHKCPLCKTTKPVTKYPTQRNAEGEYVRALAECRDCRDARRATRKAEKDAAKATAA
jgi:hypothetical protein